jgi:hypothetical protein
MNPVDCSHQSGSRDGTGAGDCDVPYRFGRPQAAAPFPFSTRQFARLLVLRSQIEAGLIGTADLAPVAESVDVSTSAWPR